MNLRKKIMKLLLREHSIRPSLAEKKKADEVLKPLNQYRHETVMAELKRLKVIGWIGAHRDIDGDAVYYPTEKGIEEMESPWNLDRRLVAWGIAASLIVAIIMIALSFSN
jgi:hypothetical protein